MKSCKALGIAVPSILAIPLVASVALAQRSAAPVQPQPLQNPEIKVPATPAKAQPPMVRDTTHRPAPKPALQKSPSLDLGQSSYRLAHDQLYLSTQDDGSPQVRAHSFKAEFTPASASYIPFLGSAASQNHPLAFHIQSITSGEQPVAFAGSVVAGLDGHTVSYQRGSVTEVYDLALDSVEQKFVFASLPTSGELVVRLAVETGLGSSWDGNTLVFSSSEGGVRYSAAMALDANGTQTPIPTELVEGGIELRVPAEFVASATFPLTIDPVITTYTVPGMLSEPVDSFAPAIAWDESNARYCVVFEEEFSAGDHDTVRAFVSAGGSVLSSGYVDTPLSSYWAKPDVANNNDSNTFLVVAEVGSPTGGLRAIHGRILDASTATLGADVLISTTDASGEKINASVGGDPALGFNTYTVVWQRIFIAGSDDDVHCRQVTALGALVGTGTILIDNSGSSLDRNPRIAKSCQGPGTFPVVWARHNSGTDRDVYAAQLNFNATITIGSTAIVTGSSDTVTPACSPIDNLGNWLLVYAFDFLTDHDIIGAHMTGVTINDSLNLSSREDSLGTGNLFEDQVRPAVDTDGVHFAYSYSESFSGSSTDYDVYVSSLDVIGGQLMVGEFFQNLAFSTTHEDFPRMCSQQAAGGSGNRMGLVWSDTGGVNLGNIEGGVYATSDFTKHCFAFIDGTLSCPCSNNPSSLGRGCDNSSVTGGASLDGSGNASIGADTAVFTTFGEKPTALSILAQGNALSSTGITFGQGRRCAAGTLKRLFTHSAVGGSITAPSGTDSSIHVRSAALGDPLSAGSVRYYYVYYRDSTVLGGCSAASTFNTSDTCQVIWRP